MAYSYVDDSIILVPEEQVMEVACLLAMFMELLGIPLSYHKFHVGAVVEYIGFKVDLVNFTLGLQPDKLAKLQGFMRTVRQGERLSKEALRKGTGRLQWVSGILPWYRPWLCELYRLLNKPGLVWRKLSQGDLEAVFHALDGSNKLRWSVKGTGLRRGLSLSYVGKHKVKADERWCGWRPQGGGCVAFADWDAPKVKVTAAAEEAIGLWMQAMGTGDSLLQCAIRRRDGGEAAADAMASAGRASLGGWWMEQGNEDWGEAWWFRMELDEQGVKDWFLIAGEWGHDIVFFEALAQLVLFVLRTRQSGLSGGTLVQACDNETTVLAHGKGMSTADPLGFVLQALGRWKCWRNVEASCRPLYINL